MKNLKVKIDITPIERRGNYNFFHYGVLVNEKTKKETEFTLLEMYEENSDSSIFELTFIDDTKVTDEITDFIVSKI